jgi:hypothetical protein
MKSPGLALFAAQSTERCVALAGGTRQRYAQRPWTTRRARCSRSLAEVTSYIPAARSPNDEALTTLGHDHHTIPDYLRSYSHVCSNVPSLSRSRRSYRHAIPPEPEVGVIADSRRSMPKLEDTYPVGLAGQSDVVYPFPWIVPSGRIYIRHFPASVS